MTRYLFVSVLLSFLSASVALSQETAPAALSELHVVGVSSGSIRTGDRIHGPEAKVSVMRPGKDVHLALGAAKATRFLVTLEPETALSRVYLFGESAQNSEVYVDGARYEDVVVLNKSRMVYVPRGMEFRRLVRGLTDFSDVPQLASFQTRTSREEPSFVVDGLDEADELQAAYLPAFVDQSRLTETLKAYLTDTPPMPEIVMEHDGFLLRDGGSETKIDITLDVPGISHPVAAAVDRANGRMFGVTLGGEGFLYQYDLNAEQWSVLASMENVDATNILYDPVKDRLILGHRGSHSHEGRLLQWTAGDGLQELNLGLKVSDMPGLTDLMERGRTDLPLIIPLALDGNLLLVRTYRPGISRRVGQPNARLSQKEMTRTYLFDLEERSATLVAYAID